MTGQWAYVEELQKRRNAPNYKMKKKKPCCDANCRQEEPVAKEGFIRITSICTWIVIIVAMVQCNYLTENPSLSYRTVVAFKQVLKKQYNICFLSN